jgi:hypothetical protein
MVIIIPGTHWTCYYVYNFGGGHGHQIGNEKNCYDFFDLYG